MLILNSISSDYPNLKKIIFIGNYVPRQCGIATFTRDLLGAVSSVAPQIVCWAIAMNDLPEGYAYPKDVRFELNANHLNDYEMASEFINGNNVDLICLQHEFGIYGGESGNYILTLLRKLKIPVVTTFHSILANPNLQQRIIVETIGKISDKIIVMSYKGQEFLNTIYGIPPEKVKVIPHGIPEVTFIDPNFYKDQFDVEGKKVILTFGLISPGKGIETMIDALPEIVHKYPDVVYIILGATHPNVLKEQGESYRYCLQRKARQLGVEHNVIFHNRFVELKELCEFLGVADVYVTPYLNEEQITSGTLAYALGSGKAIISTPYWYAKEILSEGKGIIVPFNNSKELAREVIDLFDNEIKRHAMRKQAYIYSRNMIWNEVAKNYLDVFSDVIKRRSSHPGSILRKKTLQSTPFEIPIPKFDHLINLTDEVGILQHAKYIVPDRNHGYCTDDNARALIVMLLAQNLLFEGDNITNFTYRYLSFVLHAFNLEKNRFRNFMSYDRKWLEEVGSEDCHGRAVWSLGVLIGLSKTKECGDISLDTFVRAVSVLPELQFPRAIAYSLIGIHAYLVRFGGDSNVKRVREQLANKLFDYYQTNTSTDWPWIEKTLTYDNGKIPQALLLSGVWLQRGDMIDAGLRLLEWLIKIQINDKGQFSFVGNTGWYTRGEKKARFDQQPIEAQSIIGACIEAYKITKDNKWINQARLCMEWFLGNNDLNIAIYDYKTGGCFDGLTPIGPNKNQGAESTLMWLLSLLDMYYLEHYSEFEIKKD